MSANTASRGQITLYHHPFTEEHETLVPNPDETLGEVLTQHGFEPRLYPYLDVWMDGVPIPPERLQWIHPSQNAIVTAKLIPRGGGGGGGKNIFSIIAGVALIATAIFVGPGALFAAAPFLTGGSLLTIGAGLALSGLTGLFAPVPNAPRLNARSVNNEPTRLVSSITGTENQALPFGQIPKAYGTVRWKPVLDARYYTEIAGEDQYLRMSFSLGYKPLDCDVADIRIENTPLTSFADVQYELHTKDADPPITLYTNGILEESLSVGLTAAGSWQIRTTATDAEEISVDFFFPRGLVEIDAQSGNKLSRSVTIEIEYKLVSEPTVWTSAGSVVATDATSSVVRTTKKWNVAKGQYDVRVRRTTADSNSTRIADETRWGVLRTIRHQDAVTGDGLARLAIRIKANEQLNGIIRRLSVLTKFRGEVWNGSSWVEQQTNLAAWAYVDQLINPNSNVAPIDKSRIDVAAFKAWADEDLANGREYNLVHDHEMTVFQSLQQIAAAGRASFHMTQDGKYSIVRDVDPGSVPQTVISPRNCWGYQGQTFFRDVPHALRVQFLDETQDFNQNEIFVYDDGFDANNATNFESLPLIGITKADTAWEDGRHHLAKMRLRRRLWHFNMDVEHIAFQRGDLIRFAHPAALLGISSGRITAVQTSGTDVIGVTLDNAAVMEAGKTYGLDIRLSNLTRIRHDIVTVSGKQPSVTFAAPIPNTQDQPAVGDMAVFGISGLETREGIVKEIKPFGPDLNARITCFPHEPAVFTADTGPIPPPTSGITSPILPQQPKPLPLPTVLSVASDEFVMEGGPDGTYQSRILVGLRVPSAFTSEALYFRGQFRKSGAQHWVSMPLVPAESGEIAFHPVKDGVTYEFRIQTHNGFANASDWTPTQNETVTGKTNPPPDVQDLQVERQADGTRKFTITYPTPPPDHDGWIVKFKLGTGHAWEDLAPLFTDDKGSNLIYASPFETNLLAAGTYTIGVKARDTSGNESVNARLIQSTLGDPRIGGAILQRDERNEGFPGTKTDCYVDSNGDLAATGTKTWADFPTDGIVWSTWTKWNRVPSNPIAYETPAIDLGAILPFNLLVNVTGQGTPTITEAHSDDDVTYTSFAAITGQIEARYIKVKVSMADTEPHIQNIIIIPDGQAEEEIILDLDMSTISGGSAGDRRIPLMKSWALITWVGVALRGTGSGWTYQVLDYSTTLGPRINTWDNGTLTDTNIGVIIKGILA